MKGGAYEQAQQWADLVEAQERSGQSGAAFCRERGVSDKLFSYWTSELRDRGRSRGRTRFAVVGEPPMLELISPSVVRARVPADISIRQLEVAEALRVKHS